MAEFTKGEMKIIFDKFTNILAGWYLDKEQ